MNKVYKFTKGGTIRMRGGHARPCCMQFVRHEAVSGTQDHINCRALTLLRDRKNRCAIFVIGAYILVFDFLPENSFQSDQSLYAFKKLKRVLSSHLLHLDDMTPASCIC